MEFRLAFIGFGNVAQAFARIIIDRRDHLAEDCDLGLKNTAIATANHGCIDSLAVLDTSALIDVCEADILFETTPLNPISGEPAASYIRSALTRGIDVVTANKGPLAFAYRELKSLASHHRATFRFEGTVMDGTPIFNLVESCLPGVLVLGFSGVLNSTTNLILTGMESGRSFEQCLAEAQRIGIAETNADYDIDGWDAAVKAVAIANVIMDADLRPADVKREGIRGIAYDALRAATASGMAVRLVARGRRTYPGVALTVAPEMVPAASVLGSVCHTSNALILETDLMGKIAMVETNPGVNQTAYALLSDMLSIMRET